MEISSFTSFAANIVVQPDPAVRFIKSHSPLTRDSAIHPHSSIGGNPHWDGITYPYFPLRTGTLIPLRTFPPVTPSTLRPQYLTPASLHPLRPSIPVRSHLPSLQTRVAQQTWARLSFLPLLQSSANDSQRPSLTLGQIANPLLSGPPRCNSKSKTAIADT